MYTYATTFDLTGATLSNPTLAGRFAVDGLMSSLTLNGCGNSIDAGGDLGSWYSFALTNGFVSGVNTLRFRTANIGGATGNPEGLRVEFTGASGIKLPPLRGTLILLSAHTACRDCNTWRLQQ
jgi:hypothetical protein